MVNGSQLVVNPFFGNVYLIWTDFGGNAIQLSRSTDFGQTWSAPETGATGTMMTGNLLGGIRAPSFSRARFNSVANNIGVVWHEVAPGTNPPTTDVLYTSKSPAGWQAKVRINDDATNTDQFMPSQDFDSNGNVTVTFYDRREDPANTLFRTWGAHVNSSGNQIHANFMVNGFLSNPSPSFIGDYHDIWSQQLVNGTERYFPAFVGIQGGFGDIYVSQIGTD